MCVLESVHATANMCVLESVHAQVVTAEPDMEMI